jgi:hypothetical protein
MFMRLSGFLPVVSRRVVVALGVTGMLLMASSVSAQDVPAAAAPPQEEDALMFDGSKSMMLLLSVTVGQEATFEAGFNEMKAGLNATAKPEYMAQAKSMQLMKVDAVPPAGQPVLYLLFLDPPVPALSYNITKILYYGGAFDVSTPEARTKVDELYAKFSASLANQNIWPLLKK